MLNWHAFYNCGIVALLDLSVSDNVCMHNCVSGSVESLITHQKVVLIRLS